MKSRRMILLGILVILLASGLSAGVVLAQSPSPSAGVETAALTNSTSDSESGLVSASAQADPFAAAAIDPDELAEPLRSLVEDYEEHGVNVIGATLDNQDPAEVTIKLSRDSLQGPENMGLKAQIERRPAILKKAGLKIDWVTVVGIDGDGKEYVHTGFLVDDLMPGDEWSLPAAMSDQEVKNGLENAAIRTAAELKMASPSVTYQSVGEDGRSATVVISVPEGGVASEGRFVDQVHTLVSQMNKEQGAKVEMLTIDIVDSTGRLIVRELDDFLLADGGTRSVWVTPELRMTGYQPSFMD